MSQGVAEDRIELLPSRDPSMIFAPAKIVCVEIGVRAGDVMVSAFDGAFQAGEEGLGAICMPIIDCIAFVGVVNASHIVVEAERLVGRGVVSVDQASSDMPTHEWHRTSIGLGHDGEAATD